VFRNKLRVNISDVLVLVADAQRPGGKSGKKPEGRTRPA